MIGKYSAREDELSYEDWVDYHRSKADTPEVFFALRDLGHISSTMSLGPFILALEGHLTRCFVAPISKLGMSSM